MLSVVFSKTLNPLDSQQWSGLDLLSLTMAFRGSLSRSLVTTVRSSIRSVPCASRPPPNPSAPFRRSISFFSPRGLIGDLGCVQSLLRLCDGATFAGHRLTSHLLSNVRTFSEVSHGVPHPPLVKGTVFREWCKAVASDSLRMAINEAEAKMKSKAGVIGRSEGGELGMKLDSGYVSPHFVTDQKTQKCELENPFILIHEGKIYNTDAVEKLVQLASIKQRPLLIVAEEVGSDALGSLILSKLSSGVEVCAIKAPGFGDNRKMTMQNIAAISGGEIVTEELGLDNVGTDIFGTCKKVIVSKVDTVIVEGAGAKKPTKEKSAEEHDIEIVKMHSDESEILLKHLLEEEENLERRQSERLNVIFKKFLRQFPVKKRRTRKLSRSS